MSTRPGQSYKVHIAVDRGATTITGWRVTPANIQEVTVAPALLPQVGAIYADRGDDATGLHQEVAARGLEDAIMRRGRRNQPLAPAQIARNHRLALIRRAVEPVFGTLKRCYRLHRMPYFNAARNRTAFGLACVAFNLRRWHALTAP